MMFCRWKDMYAAKEACVHMCGVTCHRSQNLKARRTERTLPESRICVTPPIGLMHAGEASVVEQAGAVGDDGVNGGASQMMQDKEGEGLVCALGA